MLNAGCDCPDGEWEEDDEAEAKDQVFQRCSFDAAGATSIMPDRACVRALCSSARRSLLVRHPAAERGAKCIEKVVHALCSPVGSVIAVKEYAPLGENEMRSFVLWEQFDGGERH